MQEFEAVVMSDLQTVRGGDRSSPGCGNTFLNMRDISGSLTVAAKASVSCLGSRIGLKLPVTPVPGGESEPYYPQQRISPGAIEFKRNVYRLGDALTRAALTGTLGQ